MTRTDTKVTYQASIERRADQLFAVIERTADTTPISNRGREWTKSSYRRSVTVIPLDEAPKFVNALVDAMAFGLARFERNHLDDPPVIERGDVPDYALVEYRREDGGVVASEAGRFWSNAEAEEAGYRLAETSDAERITTHNTSRTGSAGVHDVITVIR